MNQGGNGYDLKNNGTYQDGAILIYYPDEKKWTAVFIKFSDQSDKTDEKGNPVR
jgi:uncharacterized protein YukJ